MNKKYNFDYIIIGSGPAGLTAAKKLSKNKKLKIALVEASTLGGSNLNTRDIPYHVSLGFSHRYHQFKNYPELSGSSLDYNFPTIVSHQAYITGRIETTLKEKLTEKGVTIINGLAHFLDSHTVAVGSTNYTADSFIIATGAKLNTGDIVGTDTVNFLTPDTAIKVRRLPKFVFVIGGGPSGCEIAEYYAELGAKVLIMEKSSHLLPREDKEVGETLKTYFEKELGMMVITSSKVVAIEQDGGVKRVIFTTKGQEKMVRIDCIVLATGSSPNTDLGLENAGVKYKSVGIGVNNLCQTSTKNIYAIGDCLGGESSTERAEYQASVLAANLTSRSKNLLSYSGFTRITNTYPEVATVGLNELDLKKRKVKTAIVYFKDLPIGKISRDDYGFIKIIADGKNHILGATIVAPHAHLMAEEFAIAIRHRLTALELASTPHVVNSHNYAIKLCAKKLLKSK